MKHQRRMADDTVTDAIRSGAYFEQGRKWYFTLFSNPIAERSFYFITLLIALVTLGLGVRAVLYILPLSEEYAFFVRNPRTDTEVPQMIKLRSSTSDTQDAALMRHFVRTYVTYRETYSTDTFEISEKHVAHYSSEQALQAYRQLMDLSNPASPKLLYVDYWVKRLPEITSLQMKLDTQPYQALVGFNVSVRGGESREVIPFVADVRFLYSPLQITQELDSVTGQPVTKFKQPEFQVVEYHAQQAAAQTPQPIYQNLK